MRRLSSDTPVITVGRRKYPWRGGEGKGKRERREWGRMIRKLIMDVLQRRKYFSTINYSHLIRLSLHHTHILVVVRQTQFLHSISTQYTAALTPSQVNVTFDLCHVLLAYQGTEHVVGVLGVTDLFLPGRGEREGGGREEGEREG